LRPVDFATAGLDSDSLLLVIGLVVSGEHGDLSAGVDGHDAATVTHVDHVSHIVNDHHHGGTGARPLRAHLLARHCVLSARLSHLDQVDKAALTLFKSTDNGLVGELREVFVLHDEIVQVVSQVIGTGGASMAVENAEKADLGPLDVEVLLALWLEDVEDDGDTVFIVVSDDSLVCIGRIAFNNAAFFL